ncbi:NAD(P)H-binding protein [Streptomyces pseudovenezuelae]|uniref:NAD(P)H-binding protein n=1 Tax=Streptomyces pseudovenezuelae TaxID=67350 RepID=UPI003717DF7A
MYDQRHPRRALTVMREQNIRRMVVTSTQGAGNGWLRINPVFKALINVSTLKAAYDDHHGLDELARASDTDWTLARPVAPSNKPAGAPLRAVQAGSDKPGTRISRADVAVFLLDTAEQGIWIHKAPLIWNARGHNPLVTRLLATISQNPPNNTPGHMSS